MGSGRWAEDREFATLFGPLGLLGPVERTRLAICAVLIVAVVLSAGLVALRFIPPFAAPGGNSPPVGVAFDDPRRRETRDEYDGVLGCADHTCGHEREPVELPGHLTPEWESARRAGCRETRPARGLQPSRFRVLRVGRLLLTDSMSATRGTRWKSLCLRLLPDQLPGSGDCVHGPGDLGRDGRCRR